VPRAVRVSFQRPVAGGVVIPHHHLALGLCAELAGGADRGDELGVAENVVGRLGGPGADASAAAVHRIG